MARLSQLPFINRRLDVGHAGEVMSAITTWKTLIEALEHEISLLTRLRDLARAGRRPLVELDVGAVEQWTNRQRELLSALANAGSERARAQRECLPVQVRGVGGSGPLASTVTLHALAGRAPGQFGLRLRQQGDALRQLRDEIALVTTRNEVLIKQVVEFTDHFGKGLADSQREDSYDARGKLADMAASGDLYSRAI
ncbi:MAG: hypothetical protein CMP23_17515 [Rickettsiales bacterium]|nr:hypothetical protein [Rickettsiales bacterium]